MRTLKVAIPAVVLAAGFLICSTASYSMPAYAKKEKKSCTFCHSQVKPMDKELMKKSLTDAGKYYAAHNHSLDGYQGK